MGGSRKESHCSRWWSRPRFATTAASGSTLAMGKYVRGDQKLFTFITAKTERCFLMKRRNLTTKWTVQYRRINKKGSVEQAEKKRRAKKSMVKTREIVGLTAEMLEKKRSARPAAKDKQRDAALKELKSRKGAKKK